MKIGLHPSASIQGETAEQRGFWGKIAENPTEIPEIIFKLMETDSAETNREIELLLTEKVDDLELSILTLKSDSQLCVR